jgi:hypothetical protein
MTRKSSMLESLSAGVQSPTKWLALMAGLLCQFSIAAHSEQIGTEFLPHARLCSDYFGNDALWFERNIPLFDCSDRDISRIYYYRWQLYKAHLKDIGPRGYIVTEFLSDVGWAWNPYQSLDDATAFHINEGRWLKDKRYLDDYITFMYSGANDRHFTDAIAAATYGRYLANGDRVFAIKNLAGMKRLYESWSDHYDRVKGIYFIEPLLDATEYTIASIDASGGKDGFRGGDAFRPTVNSFMFGNAMAISRLSALAGDTNAAAIYAANAAALKDKVQTNLWNDSLQHFIDRYKVNNQFVHYWDFIRGRELAGYVPWTFELPDNDPKYSESWKHLLSPEKFSGPYGLRTVEPSYEYYLRQYRYEKKSPECQWNGPAWPFDTSLVLAGVANLLNDYTQNVMRADDYVRLLQQYARQHFLNGEPDLQEDYNPDTGKVIVGLARSHHYNHSEFNDLVITGLAGLRPRADNTLEINPLIPADPRSTNAIEYFCLENVPYHGRNVTILFDRDGRHYKKGAGLSVFVDGRCVVKSAPLAKQTIPIAEPKIAAAPQPVDVAVNFTKKGFPLPSASANNAAREIFQAVDGWVWFWSNVRNYWSNAGSRADEDWFSLDFGRETKISSVQLYFYADGKQFKAPLKYAVQVWAHGNWENVSGVRQSPKKPLANGENTVTFPSVSTTRLRLTFTNPKPAAIALVEVKAFE